MRRINHFFKSIKDGNAFPIIDLSCIEVYKDPKDKRIKLARDKRTYQENGIWYIKPIAITADRNHSSIFIICPYCGGIHAHGNGSDGFKTPHCDYHAFTQEPEYYIFGNEERKDKCYSTIIKRI